ncbi:MAG: L-lactate permease [Clostridiales bacterium]|nr:L-lactate permease [Clostridiales bacterium]
MLKFIIALLPILWLIISLSVFKITGYKASIVALLLTSVTSLAFFNFNITNLSTSILEGFVMGLWPIMIVIIASIFTYNVTVYTKAMEKIKEMLSNITEDKRIQVLIIAWAFGGFLEAIAGYGTAVAIPASILIALGFDPIFSAVICLIANTVPTAFGAVGIPVITLSQVTNLSVNTLSYFITLQLTIFIILIPFILVIMTTRNIKGIKGVGFIAFMSGLSFALPQIFVAKYLGAELPALIGSILSLITTIYLARRKSRISYNIDIREAIISWMPYILVFILVLATSPIIKPLNQFLGHYKTLIYIYSGENAKPYIIKWLTTPGLYILIAGFIGGLIQGANVREIYGVLVKTLKQLSKSTITVLTIVAMAKVMGYSGMIQTIAAEIVSMTGSFYPIISPIIGAIGTFVTGSDTSSNLLFGQLQRDAALNLKLNEFWLVAANTSGATAGKMISPQSIAIATSATGLMGSEGKILNKTIAFCIGYVFILGLLVYFISTIL